jgi:hypothetical protein
LVNAHVTTCFRFAQIVRSPNGRSRPFAELLIDGEEDRTLRAVLIGLLREIDC